MKTCLRHVEISLWLVLWQLQMLRLSQLQHEFDGLNQRKSSVIILLNLPRITHFRSKVYNITHYLTEIFLKKRRPAQDVHDSSRQSSQPCRSPSNPVAHVYPKQLFNSICPNGKF
jgi:hypothetical protein